MYNLYISYTNIQYIHIIYHLVPETYVNIILPTATTKQYDCINDKPKCFKLMSHFFLRH